MKRFQIRMKRIIAPLIGFLAVGGLADSAYLVLRHFGFVHGEPYLVASACEIGRGACEAASQPEFGGIMGISPPIFGGLYFAAVVLFVIVRIHIGRWLFPSATLAFLLFGVAYSGYLLYMMVAVLDQPCPYCLAAHSINVAVLVLYVASLLGDRAQMRRAR